MKTSRRWLYLKLLFTTCSLASHQFIVGATLIFSGILFAKLREPSSTLTLTPEQASWIASVPNLVCPIGSVATGMMADKIGRRKALHLTFIPLIISWGILGFFDTYKSIMIARTLLGYSEGTGAYVLLYITETSPTVYRPLFLALVLVVTGMGMLTISVLGILYTWQTLSQIFCVISLACAVLLFAVPEPPIWLRSKGLETEAERVEKWFGLDPLMQMPGCGVSAIASNATAARQNPPPSKWSMYTSRSVWKPALITLTFFICQQGTGFYILLFYSVDVIRDCRVPVDGMAFNAYLSVTRIVASVIYAMQYETKRRTLVVISSVGMSVGMSSAVGYLYAFDGVHDPPYQFVLTAAFLAYVFFAVLAILPLPWSITGELFPMAVKGTMNGVIHSCGYELLFLATKIYPMMVMTLGIKLVWSIFAGFCLMSAFFGAFILPETKGKSLDEILTVFEPKKKAKIFS